MYKIINVTDKEGNVKEEFMEELRETHPDMNGELLYPLSKTLVDTMFMSLCLVWTDKSDKMLRTSTILDYEENGDIVTVTTVNSIYTLERME